MPHPLLKNRESIYFLGDETSDFLFLPSNLYSVVGMSTDQKVLSTPSKANMYVLLIISNILLHWHSSVGLFLFPILMSHLNCTKLLPKRGAPPNYCKCPILHLSNLLFLNLSPCSLTSDDNTPARILPCPLKKKSKPDSLLSEPEDGREQPEHLSSRTSVVPVID